jgi:putative ABC transport system ATP-binding protein
MPSEVRAVDNVDLEIKEGDFVSIMGPSGSGKTTLLDIIGCLMRPTYGKVFLDGRDTAKLTESELARLRGKMLGFIFQQYNLIKTFTAIENVALAIRINGKGRAEAEKKAIRTLETVGLGERMTHKPSELSGGESQRVAIARALANEPKIILGDEPTGNLDSKNGQKIIELLKGLHRKGYTIVLVTHDVSMNRHAQRCIRIMDGKIVSCAG